MGATEAAAVLALAAPAARSEALTVRKMIGFMSDSHIDPDIAVEVFILEPAVQADTEAAAAEPG